MGHSFRLALIALGACFANPALAQPPVFDAQIVERFDAEDAYQAVAVDADYFYAIANTRITRHNKIDGSELGRLENSQGLNDALIHLDSGVVIEDKLYAAHSNYPGFPMSSSVEVWDLQSMRHIESHKLGVMLGSLTWLDWHENAWWGTFANYDIVQRGNTTPYGETKNTVVVKFDADFKPISQWTLPAEILRRMSPMSNSGGSWGADGHLYLSGHDDPEVYVMALPESGSELVWLATIRIPGLNGQGIAWDRTDDERHLYAILRATRQALKISLPAIGEDSPR